MYYALMFGVKNSRCDWVLDAGRLRAFKFCLSSSQKMKIKEGSYGIFFGWDHLGRHRYVVVHYIYHISLILGLTEENWGNMNYIYIYIYDLKYVHMLSQLAILIYLFRSRSSVHSSVHAAHSLHQNSVTCN